VKLVGVLASKDPAPSLRWLSAAANEYSRCLRGSRYRPAICSSEERSAGQIVPHQLNGSVRPVESRGLPVLHTTKYKGEVGKKAIHEAVLAVIREHLASKRMPAPRVGKKTRQRRTVPRISATDVFINCPSDICKKFKRSPDDLVFGDVVVTMILWLSTNR